jgi:uncharacterized protein YutE (UPF0331/DUF86 family)
MPDRITRLEKNLITLEEMRTGSFTTRQSQWALRYGLLESIQIVIDLACELVSRRNLGSPASYRECIQILAQFNLVEAGLAASIEKMVGLRNLLVHDYDEIDVARLTPLLNRLDDFRAFAANYLRVVDQ